MSTMELTLRGSPPEVDRLFDDHFFHPFAAYSKNDLIFTMDIYEEEGNVVVKMSVHQIRPDEPDIAIENCVVTIIDSSEEET